MKIGQGFQPEEGELFRHATFYARYGWTEIVSYVLWSLNRTTVQTARALQATDVKQDFRLAMKPSSKQKTKLVNYAFYMVNGIFALYILSKNHLCPFLLCLSRNR